MDLMTNDALIRDLERTYNDLLRCLEGLTEAQFSYKMNPHVWSIHECLEHMVITEIAVYRMVMQKAASKNVDSAEILGKEAIAKIQSDRSVKSEAPDDVKPVGRFNNVGELMEKFRSNRQRLEDALTNEKVVFDGQVFVHPMLGEMTKKDWLNFMIHHCERHCRQIEEIRSFVQFQMIQ